ncbi:endolysin [Enterobacteria phage PRDavocado]
MQYTLWDIISRVESNGNLKALRFEPEYYQRRMAQGDWNNSIIQNIRAANKCSLGTARMIYCSSWGAVQIMGFNLYLDGAFNLSVAHFMENEAYQVNEFRRFLLKNGLTEYTPERLASDKAARVKFAKVYNGAESYADLILQACQFYGVK